MVEKTKKKDGWLLATVVFFVATVLLLLFLFLKNRDSPNISSSIDVDNLSAVDVKREGLLEHPNQQVRTETQATKNEGDCEIDRNFLQVQFPPVTYNAGLTVFEYLQNTELKYDFINIPDGKSGYLLLISTGRLSANSRIWLAVNGAVVGWFDVGKKIDARRGDAVWLSNLSKVPEEMVYLYSLDAVPLIGGEGHGETISILEIMKEGSGKISLSIGVEDNVNDRHFLSAENRIDNVSIFFE